MSDLKQVWKKTAKSLVLAANDLGEALVESAKVGREQVVKWAQSEDAPIETDAVEMPADESPANHNSTE